MTKYRIIFKDGKEIVVGSNNGYYWGYDINLRAEMLIFSDSQFKAKNILGVAMVEAQEKAK